MQAGPEQLALALQAHRSGRLADAISLYRAVLRERGESGDVLRQLGAACLQAGQPEQGVQALQRAVALDPADVPARKQLGNALKSLARSAEALACYDGILALSPDDAEAHFLRGVVLGELGRAADALSSYGRAAALAPDNAQAHFNHANALRKLGHVEAALAAYQRAIELQPDHADAHNNRGNVLRSLGRADEALASYERAAAARAGFAEPFFNRGNLLEALGQPMGALPAYEQALAIQPGHAGALAGTARVCMSLGRGGEALAAVERQLAIDAGQTDAWNRRGNALRMLGRHAEALTSYQRALALDPDCAEAHNNAGVALHELGRSEEALACYAAALQLKPDYAEASFNQGVVLGTLGRPGAALASYERAAALAPDNAQAHLNRGTALLRIGRPRDALAAYEHAIQLQPGHAEAHHNRGHVLVDLGRKDEALASYRRALALDPGMPFLRGTCLHAGMQVCDWTGLEADLAGMVEGVQQGLPVIAPFPLLGVVDDPALQLEAARIYADRRFTTGRAREPFALHRAAGRLRIGYYSADFHDHATVRLMVELFEKHDRDRFEFHAFSFGPDRRDTMRNRIVAAFDRFVDVRHMDDRQIAQLSRDAGIDIAVDLKGYTTDSRPGIFAAGCAPVQASYLGYPGTQGADWMHYLIADRIVVPPQLQPFYTEKLVYLPHSFQANDSGRPISARSFTRQEVGLPESGFVFCCFNNNYKIVPVVFAAWMRILQSVPGSVLWLLEDNPAAAANLRRAAQARGVDPGRLVFARRFALAEHLARHRLADLFLDTLPYNAHTTASDALWAGLPVLTCAGRAFAGRVAASLLHALGLPELVMSDPAAYEATAIALAGDPQRLRALRDRLARNRSASPLFDGRLLARHLEAAYAAMHLRHLAGLPPGIIEVAAET